MAVDTNLGTNRPDESRPLDELDDVRLRQAVMQVREDALPEEALSRAIGRAEQTATAALAVRRQPAPLKPARRRLAKWAVAVGLACLVGCKPAGQEKFTPSEAKARQALEAALTRWRDGQAKPEPFPLDNVQVQVADQTWTDGQKLQGFEIVGEEPAGTGPRVFTVKLKTAKGEQTTKYYVVGIDPLWIYGEADYRKLSGG